MNHFTWDSEFAELYERCLKRYQSGDKNLAKYYSDADLSLLTSIGYKPREFFDFVEDFAEEGAPSLSTAVMIASARRDFLRWEMDGELSGHEIKPDELPGKGEELGGFLWLPRILMKARGKLKGELDPDVMFCCGGDRKFLSTNNIAPADFLRAVWSAGDDDDKMVHFVKTHTSK